MLTDIWAAWPREKPELAPRFHIGPLASGTSVLADGYTSSKIIEQHRQLLGVEMEAYGVFAASEEAARPRPVPIVVKSVVDFADGSKDDRFQQYCAYASAQLLRHFVEQHT